MDRISRRSLLLLMLGVAIFPLDAIAAPPARPVILVIPSGQNAVVPASGTVDTKKISDLDRIYLAAKAVKAILSDEAAVDAVLFDMEQPAIQRAVLESKLAGIKDELTEEQKVKIATMYGATHIASVNAINGTLSGLKSIGDQVQTFNTNTQNAVKAAQKGKADPKKTILTQPVNTDPSNAPSLVLSVMTISKGKIQKRWEQSVMLGTDDNTTVADLANAKGTFPSSWASAARSLVLKFLNENLKDARMAAVDRTLLPPQATPQTEKAAPVEKPIDALAEAAALTTKGQTFVSEGQIVEGINLLRYAVDHAPLAAVPRLALAEAYATTGRLEEASGEVRRARRIVKDMTADQDSAFSAILARSLVASADPEGAKNAYLQLLRDKPDDTVTRLQFAELLLRTKDASGAEVQYRIIRKKDPANVLAAVGFAQLVASRSDMDEALRELMAIEQDSPRHAFGTTVFTILANVTVDRMQNNRRAWEAGTLNRETFYKATTTLSQRATQLLAMLTLAPAPKAGGDAVLIQHRRRVLAGNLLAQAATSLLTFIETGDQAAGIRAKSQADECATELRLLAPKSEVPLPVVVPPPSETDTSEKSGSGTIKVGPPGV
jgi:predicted Zn-dependent protease